MTIDDIIGDSYAAHSTPFQNCLANMINDSMDSSNDVPGFI